MLAYHRHVRVVKCLTSLPLQGLLVLVISVRVSLALKLFELLRAQHFKFHGVFTHRRRLSNVLRVKVALENAWNVWRGLSFLNYCLPVNVGAPRMCFDPTDLTLRDATSRVLVQH